MKKTNIISSLIALSALGVLIAIFPPFQVTWHRFLTDPAPLSKKVIFLMKVYALPCCLAFSAIILMQLQAKLSMWGAKAASVFPIALFASGCMMAAFRSMVSGVGGIPGYALGMALAYTVVSRVHSIQPSGELLFGRPLFRIVWRGEVDAQKRAAAQLQERERGSGPQEIIPSSKSNSTKNSSLSLSRAEAGI